MADKEEDRMERDIKFTQKGMEMMSDEQKKSSDEREKAQEAKEERRKLKPRVIEALSKATVKKSARFVVLFAFILFILDIIFLNRL